MVNGVKLIEADKLNEKAARNSCFYRKTSQKNAESLAQHMNDSKIY